ncbi:MULTISPECIES: ABC transporter ATP-binding protein [Brevibacterium]|uniref:ABC-2 type transport system ATP-binding protein n=2 Tax=Brevibacterium linens TaxID=1703 RepID=A0A2H1ID38_BRELN|nr:MULTISPECIES: ABC transporter ATP-binding protein [Brevibacterium]MDN5588197.1 ABC transporter ATP-binding protein [Brevibacterium sp.]MDN5604336.1 ABC transporter ATP-binding protein [Kocuria sp.]KAB1946369.1 ABC transporter ATP-binding protein [Brevibacterium linens ATCC 9172]SMX72912.1 ABC-2 type transport system ATP-binding protein [Brevibacterium linens]SMX95274.1 ABC-2 type transport system ATP-binding protein [Brevibacterium linens ATCC 9172]
MTDTTPPLAVEAQQLVKRYKNKAAVDSVNLQVPAGETFGVLGTNGAGKTTTMEMIAGLRKPDDGSVRILGLDPFTDRSEVRQVLGVQLQHANLHDALTARELVDLYRSFYPDPLDAHQALAMVELQEKARTRFSNLSGGQMQRLSIALALVGQPQVVILDELTTGLDPVARRRVWSTIEALQDQTVILVSHAMDEVERLCDRVALIDAGRVIAQGTPDDLKAQASAATLEDAFVKLTGRALPNEEDHGR